jgi:EAL domain-containing protein (putative c-di-GMP-specific phosphodiesterase class I)/ActR/RegA family two-component response regulator
MQEEPNLADLSVLVVEDRPLRNRRLCKLLHALGAARVVSADAASRALEILEIGRPRVDVVVCDLAMPDMDGIAFIREIAERKLATPLVIATYFEPQVFHSVEAIAEEYGVRILGTVEEPVSASKLLAILARNAGPALAAACDVVAMRSFAPHELAGALRTGQFETRFQPKVRMATGLVCGAEALVRWRHPRHGLMAPKDFLAAIEAWGFIDALTWQVLRTAAESCLAWRDSGLDVTVSVNLSSLSLDDIFFADRLANLVAEAGLQARHLFLELTESAAARNLGRKLENLSRLRMMGFGLSIDDYGTGYSSLYRLSRIPFTELKIDREFVRRAPMRASDRALLESSLRLASKLGITAVAEGVETEREWKLLRSLGCPVAQGFYIGRPMSAATFVDWASARARQPDG